MAAPETTPYTAAVGLGFDTPADPVVLAAVGTAAVLCLLGVLFLVCNGRRSSSTADSAGRDDDSADRGGAKTSENLGSPSPVVKHRYNTRGHRVPARDDGNGASPTGQAATAEQVALCEMLYDAYDGVVPAGGIQRKTVRECALSTAEIRRQFKSIKQAREANGGAPPAALASPSRPTRPATRRSSSAAAKNKSQESGRTVTSPRTLNSPQMPPPSMGVSAAAAKAAASAKKKPPVSPRRSPTKRSATSRPAPSSPKSGGGGAPAAKRVAAVSVLPRESPMRTRGKTARKPSVRVGSPKSTPTKRAAAAASITAVTAAAAVSPRSGGGTPSKRGKPSTLEVARREAQQRAADVASTRASSLRASSRRGKA